MKKILSLALALVLSLAVSSMAFAATENVDYFQYEGETYYMQQKDGNPAADLQPGEELTIPLSDNASFVPGIYRITVASCGNRELITIKLNGEEIGTINREGTGFGMDQMTNDVLDLDVELTPDDSISIYGQEGEYYGWVDYVRFYYNKDVFVSVIASQGAIKSENAFGIKLAANSSKAAIDKIPAEIASVAKSGTGSALVITFTEEIKKDSVSKYTFTVDGNTVTGISWDTDGTVLTLQLEKDPGSKVTVRQVLNIEDSKGNVSKDLKVEADI